MDNFEALQTKIETAKAAILSPTASPIEREAARERLPIFEAAATDMERRLPIMTRKRAYD